MVVCAYVCADMSGVCVCACVTCTGMYSECVGMH